MLVFSHVLKLSINLFAVFLIIILITNVLKKAALNNFRGHITAKKMPQKAKSCDILFNVHFGLQQANAGGFT